MSSHVMAYFDPCKDTEIIADVSPVGLGALLCQKEKLRDGTEKISAIAYASKALTDVEQRYSQIEKEALALVWACEKFRVYMYGKSFTLVHKPLEYLFNKPGSRSQARIERWTMRLQEYDFIVCYEPGSNIIIQQTIFPDTQCSLQNLNQLLRSMSISLPLMQFQKQ